MELGDIFPRRLLGKCRISKMDKCIQVLHLPVNIIIARYLRGSDMIHEYEFPEYRRQAIKRMACMGS